MLRWGSSPQNFVTAVGLKTRVIPLPDGENSLTTCTFVSIQYQSMADRQTDGQSCYNNTALCTHICMLTPDKNKLSITANGLTTVGARWDTLPSGSQLDFAFLDDLTRMDMLRPNCETPEGTDSFRCRFDPSADCSSDDIVSCWTIGSGRRPLPAKNSDRFADRFGPRIHHCTAAGVADIIWWLQPARSLNNTCRIREKKN